MAVQPWHTAGCTSFTLVLIVCECVSHCSLSARLPCSLLLESSFSLSVHEHTDLTVEQDEYVHLVTDRLATSGTNRPTQTCTQSQKVKGSSRPSSWYSQCGALGGCFTIPSIYHSSHFLYCMSKSGSQWAEVSPNIWKEEEGTGHQCSIRVKCNHLIIFGKALFFSLLFNHKFQHCVAQESASYRSSLTAGFSLRHQVRPFRTTINTFDFICGRTTCCMDYFSWSIPRSYNC